MSFVEKSGLALLRRFNPETAHSLALRALRSGLAPLPGPVTTPRLTTEIAGLTLSNPIGLAAGFDKNATAITPLSRAGFGFIEVGAATPRPQSGNDKPRLFRLTEDRAAINRFGFNNDGMDQIADRLMHHPDIVPIGLNLGANKDSDDREADFAEVLDTCGPYIDFATVNVSSPNTASLRDLQGKDALGALLGGVIEIRNDLPRAIPIFLKIAPDLNNRELADIAEVAVNAGIDAIVATNTTLSRTSLKSPHKSQIGGLSGAPLFDPSTRILAQLSKLTGGKLPLIGVGGIGSAQNAFDKIKAGASAVQLYTAMVYQGISLAAQIAEGLDKLLEIDGYANVSDAVGVETDNWL